MADATLVFPTVPIPPGDPAMDPNLQAMATTFASAMMLSFKAQADHHAGMMARLGDNTALDHRLLTGALMSELFTGTAPSKYASLQTASHVPGVQSYAVPK